MFVHMQKPQRPPKPSKADGIYGRKLQGVSGRQYGAIASEVHASPVDCMGNTWSGGDATTSSNLLTDFTSNVTVEMQGRVQAACLYRMTDDRDVRKMPGFLLARDTMHQNRWLAAAHEREKNSEEMPAPHIFPQLRECQEYSYQAIDFSDRAHRPRAPGPQENTRMGCRHSPTLRPPPEGMPMNPRRPTRRRASTAPPSCPTPGRR